MALSFRAETNHRILPGNSHGSVEFEHFVELIARLHNHKSWYHASIAGASLAHKVVRTLLWNLISEDSLLFQAGIFVAGTHSNTCGIPSHDADISPAQAVMRGASLASLRTAAFGTEHNSYKTVAVALLAGWERRFGDPEFFKTHMRAWKSLPLPEHALDENYVLALLDVTFEVFQDSLNEQCALEEGAQERSPFLMTPANPYKPQDLPPALRDLFGDWPEATSLRAICCKTAAFTPYAPTAVPEIRQLIIEVIAWDPSHTQAYTPTPEYEDRVDPVQLNILYHVRAALISITGKFLRLASDYHHVQWEADIEGALYFHALSCRHLKTYALVQAGYAELALWSRWIMCAISRVPEADTTLRRLLEILQIQAFDDLDAILSEYIYPESAGKQLSYRLYTELYLLDTEPDFGGAPIDATGVGRAL
jgi:hypothetical protein